MAYSFTTALSGLRASSESLGVTGNNIANANTTGFKSGTITFADVFTNSLGVRLNGAGSPIQIGNGVRTAATGTNFGQGGLTETGSSTSAAIQGNGFFVLGDQSGALSYTRAGDFILDREGYLVATGGQKVQGYAAVDGAIPPGSSFSTIKVPIGEAMPPKVTTEATLRMNLKSDAADGSEFHAPVRVYDSKGVPRVLDIVFTKQSAGSYSMTATLDGAAATLSSTSMNFDSDGLMTDPATLTVTPDQSNLDSATLPSIDINLFQTNADGLQGPANFTNFSTPSAVAATDQDGFSAGTLTGLSLSTDRIGTLAAVFSNGQTRPLGRLAVATFNSQDGLRHLGGNQYGETPVSGQASIGEAGSGGRGDIAGGSLEQSNVDIATEFTNLIVAQRGFQANSRIITTINQTLQDLLQTI